MGRLTASTSAGRGGPVPNKAPPLVQFDDKSQLACHITYAHVLVVVSPSVATDAVMSIAKNDLTASRFLSVLFDKATCIVA